jgi:DNA-binding transcriptional LysR family regulator
MLDGIDALVALEAFGTVSEAATRLRLTQSAVSKRLRVLSDQVGFALIEPDGRRVRLTARGAELAARARPLVAELRDLMKPTAGAPGLERTSFSIALADSIASSWGPAVLRRALEDLSAKASASVSVSVHAHRSVLVLESVRLGRYDAGVCAEPTPPKDLVSHPLVDEPLVLVASGLASRLDRTQPLITIEPTSATWRAVHPLLRASHPALLAGEMVFVESFSGAVQMVRAGFGNGMVPLGLATELRLPLRALRPLRGVARRVALVARKSTSLRASFAELTSALERSARRRFA